MIEEEFNPHHPHQHDTHRALADSALSAEGSRPEPASTAAPIALVLVGIVSIAWLAGILLTVGAAEGDLTNATSMLVIAISALMVAGGLTWRADRRSARRHAEQIALLGEAVSRVSIVGKSLAELWTEVDDLAGRCDIIERNASPMQATARPANRSLGGRPPQQPGGSSPRR